MIQAMVKDYGLESFTFGKVCLGDVAPRIGGVKVNKISNRVVITIITTITTTTT